MGKTKSKQLIPFRTVNKSNEERSGTNTVASSLLKPNPDIDGPKQAEDCKDRKGSTWNAAANAVTPGYEGPCSDEKASKCKKSRTETEEPDQARPKTGTDKARRKRLRDRNGLSRFAMQGAKRENSDHAAPKANEDTSKLDKDCRRGIGSE